MLTIRNLAKAFSGTPLFEDVSMTINYGDRVALVGPNGSGKTTLFSLILGEDTADSGEINRDEWTTVGYLPQEGEALGNETVLEVATGRAGAIPELEEKLRKLEEAGTCECIEYYETQAKFDALNDPQFEAKAKKMLHGLGFSEDHFTRPAAELSGGWVMRAHLARLLAMEPDLLMLDEPTNHLDLSALLWFQNHLKNQQCAVLLISHDRQFMDDIVQKVFEFSDKKLLAWKGNYSEYEVQKQEAFVRDSAAYKNQQKEIAEIKDFVSKFRNVSSKAAQAQSRLKMLDKMVMLKKPVPPRKPYPFRFPSPVRGGQRSISLEGIHMAYGDNKVYEGLDLDVQRGDRTVLVGPNGAGKSTLLKILAGELKFQKGKRTEGHNCRLGYFSQHRAASLDPNNTVIDEVMKAAPEIREDEARGILGSFMFRKEEIYKKTTVLSGGEKSRLNLVKFLVDPPNLLLMDEPTTHLDILTVESLIIALERYEGSLVFISHDVHFIRKLATKVLHVNKGTVTSYAGDYDYFLEKTNSEGNERAAITA
ncbi:MAG: ABC-F family ATP-binding cassette domain-containing protein [Verrucomicrobiota bacterium]|jgi:ATP-binding cassette subfamily F protein 3